MSAFKNDVVYVVINVADFTMEKKNMVRLSVPTDINVDSLRKSNDGLEMVVTVLAEFADRFSMHTWCTKKEIDVELAKAKWIPSV